MKFKKHEKMAFTPIHFVRRLKPYFEGWLVKRHMEYPLKIVVEYAQGIERMAKWKSYLNAYSIMFDIEKQVVANLLSDLPIENIPFDDNDDTANIKHNVNIA